MRKPSSFAGQDSLARDAADRSLARFRRLGLVLLAALGIVGASALAVWPLWALATNNRAAFTALVGLFLAALLVAASARRMIRRRAGRARPADQPAGR
ncbi:MAG: hypothetical protein JNG85_12845 [Spirochaetaceae bacterium]|nr:hypothetical protein [Spirochaetaceae bacterium]